MKLWKNWLILSAEVYLLMSKNLFYFIKYVFFFKEKSYSTFNLQIFKKFNSPPKLYRQMLDCIFPVVEICDTFRKWCRWNRWPLLLREKCPYSEFFWPVFSRFGLNRERYYISLRIHSEGGKIGTKKTLNMNTFHAASSSKVIVQSLFF